MTSVEVEPATFRFVAQHLNQIIGVRGCEYLGTGDVFKLADGLILKTNFVTKATVAAHVLRIAGSGQASYSV